jgi:Eisosome component PIL1
MLSTCISQENLLLSELTLDCRNRALSIRSKKKDNHGKEPSRHTFSMATLRGMNQAELSKKLFKVIKTESHAIGAYESAGRERLSIASQLSDWGESTNDDSISDISDKLGVIMSEVGEQEDLFAQNLEDYRSILKQIRNTEASVQPSRDNKAKISDEIQKLKYKDPSSTKLVTLEQELVRAEAQNLVAEAQLTNIVRQRTPLSLQLMLTSYRPAKNSRKLMTFTSPPRLSALRSKSSLPNMAAAC